MKRGLLPSWLLSLLGMACVLLAACSWSPRSASRSPADGEVLAVAAARHDVRPPLPPVGLTVPPVPAGPLASEEPAPARTAGPSTRSVHEPNWSPFATVGGVTLVHPASRVERVGFHESNHDGARQLEVHPSAANPVTLESRGRGTGSRSAADVVVDPQVEMRVPVSGTVIRSGSYVLYCDHTDDFAVIEPKEHPGWEVKVLHIDGVRVSRGDRVQAGVTVLAGRARQLPFRSQVDDHTAKPSWPHVHIEVVDPSIPDRPSSGGEC
ncbi:MAG: hypothetical protein M3252_08995 [Actinomycetota bacterium]|nr:hypothetical protein [Actinomycetota bacterium]